ncbi:patatin-like phospholipase RssA [Alloalcanivorax mobilis]|uniref:patatin-like phospholipase RssA n=1 Tax=Alloalcanivorax mobilis TaxID=2019569 RepID=UPI000B5B2645|nr:patatin-like phospholipase RssA [Alloalcanivorax mobilis]ASK33367.1 patatin [Alcanivorax sp. N3-2A]|tara:strand:- start:21548 stop:22474 length:927 start_codon:yes stop_codon:yes gene_type:complete
MAELPAPTGVEKPKLGLALGSGSARGWAHIGVIQALEDMGVRPDVVAGTSIGALVGGAYVNGALSDFSEWVKRLTTRDVFSLMDFTFSGGVVKGEKLFGYFEKMHANPDIEELDQRFVTVATDMKSGREIWISKGPILDAARASCALPGVFSPFQHQGRWMLDGGLVNPVPVSAARAFGADVVIAVNLNAQLVGAHLSRQRPPDDDQGGNEEDRSLWQKMTNYFSSGEGESPGFFDVIASSVNIMQDRITRSRMAGDPPEITLIPLLEDFALMDFHRAKEAIDEGYRLVERHAADIRAWLGSPDADRV